jgi:pullulanase
MTSTKMIQDDLKFIYTGVPGMIIYQINNNANGDNWKNILVVLNGNASVQKIDLPNGSWILAANENKINQSGLKKITGSTVNISAISANVFFNK